MKRLSHLLPHVKQVGLISIMSGLGMIASAAFQFITIRALTPSEFGLLAAMLAFSNLIAVGSGALRNSVAVHSARSSRIKDDTNFFDSSFREAAVLSIAGILLLSVLFLTLANDLGTGLAAPTLVIATVFPYFLFARSSGLLQGAGHPISVVMWSSGSLIIQVVLVAGLLLIQAANTVMVLVLMLLVAVLSMAGATIQAHRLKLRNQGAAFTSTTLIVLSMSVLFSWLTASDVIFVRIFTETESSGIYAAAAVVAKLVLLIPGALTLYLLPKLVSNSSNRSLTSQGILWSLGVTFGMSLLYFFAVFPFSPFIASVFGPSYSSSAETMPWLTLAWLPWACAQALLVRMTAVGRWGSVLMLLGVTVFQTIVFVLTLPNITNFVWAVAASGVLAFIATFGSHYFHLRRLER